MPWRPVSDHRAHSAKLFVALAVALAITVLVLLQFARLAKKDKVNFSDGTFRLRGATAWGKRFDRHPELGPYLFADPTGERKKDLFVSHIAVGDSWSVFVASPTGDRTCTLQWRPASRDLLDPCSKRTYPITGDGLTHFAWKVTGSDQLVIYLNRLADASG